MSAACHCMAEYPPAGSGPKAERRSRLRIQLRILRRSVCVLARSPGFLRCFDFGMAGPLTHLE
jgi:hypothetical protein